MPDQKGRASKKHLLREDERAREKAGVWVSTEEMSSLLGVHCNTVLRLKRRDFLLEGTHWRKKNPLSDRSHLLWHPANTLKRMGAASN